MGQRHQVYVRLPEKFYNQGNANNQPEQTIGIHHQWLYGWTAIRLLRNYLTFVSQEGEQHPKSSDPTYAYCVLQGSYSCDPDRGYFHGVHKLDQECLDPRKGDNNNGITVIDLRGDKPKYAFLSVGHLETLEEGVQHPDDPADGQDISYQNYVPIDAEHWMKLHYGKDWKVKWRDEGDIDHLNEVTEWLNFITDHDELSVMELADIFPDMVSEKSGEGLVKTANTLRFIDVVPKGFAVKSTTIKNKRVKKKKKSQVTAATSIS
jgi:hypothetical protein